MKEEFSYHDIKWVRNVKRDGGKDWAYLNEGETFWLHWSSTYKNEVEALKPLAGEIILLYQRPQSKSKNTHITHLVTPVNNLVQIDENNPTHKWYRCVRVIAINNIPKNSVKSKDLYFSKVSRGHTFPIERILLKKNGVKEVNKPMVQEMIWNSFKNEHFKTTYSEFISEFPNQIVDNNIELSEGAEREVIRKHLLRERRPELVAMKKESCKDNLICECCSFDFSYHFGVHGADYIECHHKTPIYKGVRKTKLSDLALVCSNCHRMLHRKNQEGKYYSVDNLKTIYRE